MGLRKENIVLIGMMGSGKSTVGRLLAERLDFIFLDTDDEIERLSGKKIIQIFIEKDETGFRKFEEELIVELTKKDRLVIATGGGVVLNQNNIKLLKEKGLIVHLYADSTILVERLKADTKRPLLSNCNTYDKIKELMENRQNLYQRSAHLEIDTNNLTPEQVVDELIEKIEFIEVD